MTRNSSQRTGRILPTDHPLPLLAVLATIMVACGGESLPVPDGGSPSTDLPVAASDGPELPPPSEGWMDVEPGVAATQGGSGGREGVSDGRAGAGDLAAADDLEATDPPTAADATGESTVADDPTDDPAVGVDPTDDPAVAVGPIDDSAATGGPADDPAAAVEPADDPAAAEEPQEVQTFPAPSATTGEGSPVARLVLPEEPPVFTRPEAIRGIYLNGWASGSRLRRENAIALAKRTEINTFVIDLKDATGYVSHPTQVMFAREVGADQEIRIRNLVGLLERLHQADIYPIARIVIVKDPLLVGSRPDLAVQDTAGGVWVDDKGLVWSNMYDRAVWDYHIALAKEAVAVGFPEIQWDYLRFPDAPEEELNRAWYPGQGPRRRTEAIREFLEYAREELGDVAMTADVFGVTTSAHTDVGIGQLWEEFIGAMDVALPMVYPSHYWVGSFGIQDPNGHPYEIVKRALTDARRRSAEVEGAGTTRPWLQDFTLGAPAYGAPEVRAQIQATYDAGVDEWILWNPSSRYSEAALAPAGGYPEGTEPTIRVGGRIVPVSEREAAVEAERLAAAAAADSVANAMVQDTAEIRR